MRHVRDQRGMNTAEYEVGTVAASGFASMLFFAWPWIDQVVRSWIFVIAMFVDRARLPVIPR